jgi:ATP-dependent helicase/nuclease subunit B
MADTRHYHGWDRPFTLAFAEALQTARGNSGGYDDLLIWVPSARAGRHILGELFTADPDSEEAFHPPRLVTPAQFIRSLKGGVDIASEMQCLYAWKQILCEAGTAQLRPLFPVLPELQRENWAYGIARQLMRLRERLVEDSLDFRGVAAASLPFDRDRWEALARLETAYLERLAGEGLRDPDDALPGRLSGKLEALPYGRLLVAGILNLSRRQAACLESLTARGVELEFHFPVGEDLADRLDDWGRPLKQYWDREPLPASLLHGCLQRAAEPRELVARSLALAEVYAGDVDTLVIGAAEVEVRDYVIERSRLSASPFYAPEGRALIATDWGRFLLLLAEWKSGASMGTTLELLRHSLFRNWARAEGIEVDNLERAILTLQKERLIRGIPQLRDPAFAPDGRIGMVRDFAGRVEALFEQRGDCPFAEWLWGILHAVATAGKLQGESREVLEQLEEVLQEMHADLAALPPGAPDHWEILRHLLETGSYYPERGADERPVSGWLELPWETAPHLVVLGLPDSEIPGPDSSDAFLTPALCRELGLYGPEEAAAFHAFRLRLIIESRRNWGRLDLLLADRGFDDSPVLPCRFLFLADEAEILDRVHLLLGERSAPESSLAADFGARLRLPQPPELTRIGVTSFSAYLANPFRFYLERLLRWQVPEPLPREMDAMAFGTLAHTVLESLNSSGEGSALVDERAIAAFLEERLDREVASTFGSSPDVPVRIQAESMRERLRAAAGVIAHERRMGWMPEKVEWAFHKDFDFLVGGVPMHGKIDLIERNVDTGAYRIIDYKTSDRSDGADKAHRSFPNSRSAEPLFPECDFTIGEKRQRWKDLQLPLYQMAVHQHTGEWPGCGYLCLTKAMRDIRLDDWSPGTEYGHAAMKCAEAIVARIREGVFPLEGASRYRDPWLEWFGGEFAATIDPDWLERHTGGQP